MPLTLDGNGLSRYSYQGTKLTGWENLAMWDAEFQDFLSMILGLLPHFIDRAPAPQEPIITKSIPESDADELWVEYEHDKIKWMEYQALARTLIRQSCGNEEQKSRIMYLTNPRDMLRKLRSEYTGA
ncbi:hypothetical protein K3495_g4037 [Podosphaera aphanis]|nr:hypothetical protein K3495_g4037 [Podosphaera aphanis]